MNGIWAHKSVCLTSALAFIILLAAASPALAQAQARDAQKEAQIVAELAAIAPASVETFKQGTEAMDRGDAQAAARFYGLVIKQAPQWDVVHRRLGYNLVGAGQTAEGMALLRQAVELKRSPENLISLAQTMAYPGKDMQGGRNDKAQALTLAKEANAKNTDRSDASYTALVAQLSLDLQDEDDFRAATTTLSERYPDAMPTHYFNAVRAAMDQEWTKADEEITQAGRMGLPPELVEQFQSSGVHTRAMAWRYTYVALYLVLAWALGLACLFILGGFLSRRTLRYLEEADPQTLTSREQSRLRSVYRKVINVAGLYYYISIPVVIFLILAVSGAVVYAFLMIGTVPVKLVLILVIGSLITIYQMIRSLFAREAAQDPGRVLRVEEAPGLWALSQEVAQTVGTRPVSEIRVTPGTEVAVYERGSFRARMQDRAERVLLVGVGVLNGFSQNSFRAVLAHEYGHFMHRDTAGGDMALRVKNDIMKFARRMILSRQNTVWNLGFQFLRLYHRIFIRISHGASRLQEVLADWLASYHFGLKAFEEGLSHVVRRSIEFERLVNRELSEAISSKRSLLNLYELQDPDPAGLVRTIDEEFQKAVHHETSEYDTHPSPAERFRLASRVTPKEESTATGMVWDLFSNREQLTSEMSSLVEAKLKTHR